MYVYQSARARTKGRETTWVEIDLRAVSMRDIFNTYAEVILALTHNVRPHLLFLKLNDIRSTLSPAYQGMTLNAWLLANGSNALPTFNTPPTYRERTVRFADIWTANYDVFPVDRRRAWNAQFPHGDKNDLLIRRANIDFRAMWQYCMVSVNGYFHRVGGSEEGLYVVDGGRSGRIANDNHLGILSFREVATVEYIPIVSGMVHKTTPLQKYSDYADITLPESVEGKTVLLVLGGYLHALDEVYRVYGSRSVRVKMANYPFAERLYDSKGKINLDSLNLTPGPENENQYTIEQLQSDAVMLAYLTLPQSFFVVVDTPYLFAKKEMVENPEIPGRYIAPMPFKPYPLFGAIGRHLVYHQREDWGRMVLCCEHVPDYDYNFNRAAWRTFTSIDNKAYSSNPWGFARAHLLELGRYEL